MKLEGRAEIHAPRPKVWAFVTDPGAIAGCVSAVQSIETLDGSRFRAHAVAGLAFFSVKVVIDGEFTEIHEPDGDGLVIVGPVPGMRVGPADARHIADHGGRTPSVLRCGCRTRPAEKPARHRALA